MAEPEEDLREVEDRNLAEYDVGFQAGLDDELFDNRKSWAWCRGWIAAKELN